MSPLKLTNNFNAELEINLSEKNGHTPIITIRNIEGKSEKNFILNPQQINDIRDHFGEYSFYTTFVKWLKDNDKEVITKDDLKTMLDCIVAHISSGYKQRDAVVDAINRLEGLYDRYRIKESSNEDRA